MTATAPAVEDYLKTVYHHTEWQHDRITPSGLAARWASRPRRSPRWCRRSPRRGSSRTGRTGPIRLTDAGGSARARVMRRHRLIETWLVREFGYAWDEVHDEAEVLEHAISDRLLEGIDEARTPHARPARRRDPRRRRHARVRAGGAPRRGIRGARRARHPHQRPRSPRPSLRLLSLEADASHEP